MDISKKFCFLIVFSFVLSGWFPTETLSVSESQSAEGKTVRFPEVRDVQFSSSGTFGYFQLDGSFVVFETEKLPTTVEGLRKQSAISGRPICFLPSNQVVYVNEGRTFLYTPGKGVDKEIDSGGFAERFAGRVDPTHGLVAVISDELVISGDGSYDWGGKKGNILRFDPQTGSLKRGAAINGFWLASLSPDKKYLTYEFGAEDNNNAYIYDVEKDRNAPIWDYFNLARHFKEIKDSSETPVKWLKSTNRFIALISDNSDDVTVNDSWIVLLDVDTRSVVWKQKLAKWFFPTDLQVVDEDRALVILGGYLHILGLKDGRIVKKKGITADALALSPDARKLVVFVDNELFLGDLFAEGRKKLYEFDKDFRFQSAYKGMEVRAPVWSPKQDAIFVFGENETIMFRP